MTETVAFKVNPAYEGLDYHALNAMLNLYDANGRSSSTPTSAPRGSTSCST